MILSEFNEIKMKHLHPIILDSIKDNGCFNFYPKGVSMLPTIVPSKDMVTLVSPDCLNKFDIVLYKRQNGQYVMHRIFKIKDEIYTMCGDNQFTYEKGITKAQIIAKAKSITKPDGTVIDCTNKKNTHYAKKLRVKMLQKRLIYRIKCLIYPLYKVIFKHNN